MPGPTVTFLGGVREIGGNKIIVQDGPDRVLFDFGPSFSPQFEQFYVNFLAPRSTSPVKDLLEFDLLPRIEGLYSEGALYKSDLAYRPPEIHAVFVSHAHLDHAGHLQLIDPTIPVHVNEGTRQTLEAIESSGSTKYGEHDWQILTPNHPVRIGRIEVQAFPVDHSVPYASGFLIRTSEGTIAYTGDFRAHGPRAQDTHAFIAAAAEEKPAMLIMEGTRAGPDPRKNFTEQGVRDGVDGILEADDRLAIVSCYPRDVDRLTTLYRAARSAGRDLVISTKTAHLLRTLAALLPREAPVPGRSEGLAVYQRTKKVYYKWEREFLDGSVDAEFVRKNGRGLLLQLDLPHFAELIDIRPEAGSPYLHSMSEP
ncbi:MAG: MBL fold metallo-hydrolase, partial [Thermoplasmata archaeon]|nr:MBL fold metallo-hydrolase [Thermoplasmata archaeon]